MSRGRGRKMTAAEAKRNDEQVEAGREAFRKGLTVDDCPFLSAFDSDRWAWIWGWQRERDAEARALPVGEGGAA